MPITKDIEIYERDVLNSLGWQYRGLMWCEFGDMRLRKKSAKKIYERYGVNHTSMDLNGRDGALPLDLGQPMPNDFINRFDVITNYGTVEHVNNQFQVFKNMHDLCRVGGIMIHVFPLEGNWPDHARYYYSRKFAHELADVCEYRIVKYMIFDEGYYENFKNAVAVTFVKEEKSRFITKEEFSQIKGIIDSGDMRRTGNYAATE